MDVKELFDQTGMKISAIAEDVKLSEEYLRNIRRGRYQMSGILRGYLRMCISDREKRMKYLER